MQMQLCCFPLSLLSDLLGNSCQRHFKDVMIPLKWKCRLRLYSHLVWDDCNLHYSHLLILWPPHAKELTRWKRPWCWEGLGAGGEGDDRGRGGWMASPTQWTWIWVDSGSWWWTGRPGVLWFMGLQGVGHNWATELKWKYLGDCLVLPVVVTEIK